jgi:hypothetical protein
MRILEDAAVSDALAYHTATRKFINEVGNEIEVYIALGAAPDRLCRMTISGPHSEVDNYTTRMELEQLRDALNEAIPMIEGSVYRHYKGGLYRMLHLATDEATGEDIVVYRSLADDRIWVRTAYSWNGTVHHEEPGGIASSIPRFTKT